MSQDKAGHCLGKVQGWTSSFTAALKPIWTSAVTQLLLLFCPKVRQDQAVAEGDHKCAVCIMHEPDCWQLHYQPTSAGKALFRVTHIADFISEWVI